MRVLTVPESLDLLHTPCQPVVEFDDKLRRTADDMLRTMYRNVGIGLAAPQVGLSIQLCVVDVDWAVRGKRTPWALVNPEIVWSEGSYEYVEGCLSLPAKKFLVRRPREVEIKFQDLTGRVNQIKFPACLLTIAIQHEMDHLKGVLISDIGIPV